MCVRRVCLSVSGLVCECMCVFRAYVCMHKLAMYNQQQSGGKLEVECLLALHACAHTNTCTHKHTGKTHLADASCAVCSCRSHCVYAINVLCDGDLNCVSLLEDRPIYLI